MSTNNADGTSDFTEPSEISNPQGIADRATNTRFVDYEFRPNCLFVWPRPTDAGAE